MTDGTDRSAAPAHTGRSALFVLVAVVFVVPLLSGNLSTYGFGGLPVLYDTVALPRLVAAVVGILVAAALGLWARRADGRVRVHATVVGLAVAAALATASCLVSTDPSFGILGQSERLEGLVTWWLYGVAAFAALQAVGGTADIRLIARVLVIAAAVLAVYGLLQFFGLDWAERTFEPPGFDPRRAFATFGNPNFLAGLLVLAAPIACGAALVSARSRDRVVWWAAFAVIAAALIATLTRGAWIAALVEIAVGVLVLGKGRVRASRRDALGFVAAALVVLAVVLVSLASSGELNITSRLADASSASERLLTLRAGVSAVAEKPLLGWGPDGFLGAFRVTRPDAYAARFGEISIINNAHSWPVQTAATIGLPAALALVVALVWAFVSTKRFAAPSERSMDPVYAGAWVGCLGFGVHMLLNVAVLGATVPFFVMLGALLAPAAHTRKVGRTAVGVAAALTALTAGGALVFGGMALAADSAFVRSRLAYAGATSDDAVAEAARAWSLNPTSVKYGRGLAEARAQRYYDLISRDPQRSPESQGLWRTASDAFAAVERSHPGDYATLAWHAALMQTAGSQYEDAQALEEARTLAERAAALDRHHAQVAGLLGERANSDAALSARSVPRLP